MNNYTKLNDTSFLINNHLYILCKKEKTLTHSGEIYTTIIKRKNNALEFTIYKNKNGILKEFSNGVTKKSATTSIGFREAALEAAKRAERITCGEDAILNAFGHVTGISETVHNPSIKLDLAKVQKVLTGELDPYTTEIGKIIGTGGKKRLFFSSTKIGSLLQTKKTHKYTIEVRN